MLVYTIGDTAQIIKQSAGFLVAAVHALKPEKVETKAMYWYS